MKIITIQRFGDRMWGDSEGRVTSSPAAAVKAAVALTSPFPRIVLVVLNDEECVTTSFRAIEGGGFVLVGPKEVQYKVADVDEVVDYALRNGAGRLLINF